MKSQTFEKFRTHLLSKYSKKTSCDILCRCKRLETMLNIDLEINVKTSKDYVTVSNDIDSYMTKNKISVLKRYILKGTLMYSLRAFLRFSYKGAAENIITSIH